MRIRRSKRIWVVALGVFVAVFLFTFLTAKFKDNEEADAANLGAFDAGYIISDYQMSNYNAMNEAEIQSFLTAKNPCANSNYSYYLQLSANKNYTWHWANGHFVCLSEERFGDGETIGSGDTAAHIIWQAAQDYRINPQVLLVLLQKETGLITDPIPNNGDYRKATGYGCPDTAACSSKYYGFKNQVRNAAALFRTVLDGGWTNYPLGNNYVQYNPNAGCGGSVVNIRSLATSALYRYTPYQPNAAALNAGYGYGDGCSAYGNRNFYSYFEDWFGGIVANGVITAPRDIKAFRDNSSVRITWEAPSNVDLFGEVKYEIVLANDNREEKKVVVGGDEREYIFGNLPEGTYIAASVKAMTKTGSNYGRVTFDYAIGRLPGSPLALAVDKENGGIKISWDEPSDTGGLKILKYEVVIADVDKHEIRKIVDPNSRSVVFYGIPLNEYFAASVKAVNALGSNYSRITFSIKNVADFDDFPDVYSGFLDMPSDETSKTAVSWAVHNGITDKNSYFSGEQALTRRQAMVLLWRMAGMPAADVYSGFLDMPSDETSKTAVSWAVHNGITDKNSYFSGEQALTRRQAMVLLWRMYTNIVK